MTDHSVSRELVVSLDDHSSITYTLRGLEGAEITHWAEFCASVFAYKPNPPPPSYFERHYRQDPCRRANLVRVADIGGDLVASCRVFVREISDGRGGSILAGGIGEVCTDDGHRRRGLSKELLIDCLAIMKDMNMKISFLHAAPAFFPVYQSLGYRCSLTEWTMVGLDRSRLPLSSRLGVRPASFPSDTVSLQRMHQRYSEQRCAGCIIRSADYWNDYLRHELDGSLWVAERENAIVGWLSLRERGGRQQQVREFGAASEVAGEVLAALLPRALADAATMDLLLPTVVWNDINGASLDWLTLIGSENDAGWMYKPLDDDDPGLETRQPHLIWPADSF